MTNSNIEIKDIAFNDSTPKALEESDFYRDWPVVYVLNSDKEMYIGETYHASQRMKQHLEREDRRRLTDAHIIASKDFTKSATLDIESSLIELYSAIDDKKKRVLQNGNSGIVRHFYSNKEEFSQDSKFFSKLWMMLAEKGLVSGSIENLKNSDLFKYSPYKALNAEQCTTRDYILENILEAFNENKKQAIFVDGFAGTGKSILAIYLLKLLTTGGDFINDEEMSETLPFLNDLKKIKTMKPNLKVAYVVSMTSFRKTLQDVFKHIHGLKSSMVIKPGDVAKENYDILIVDEAHRLMKRKNLTGYKSFDDTNKKLGLPCNKNVSDGDQLDWIRKKSQIQIMFYDSTQSIKPSDVDKEKFDELKRGSIEHRLTSQMRCKGGMYYTDYVRNILSCTQTEEKQIANYDFRLFENIDDFCNALYSKEKEESLCRIVSGYGFEWKSKNNINTKDIVIDNRSFYWNRTSEKWVLSIEGKEVVEEVGCIHTIQGYDLNYCGVIFGPEIAYSNGNIVINKDKYFDIKGKADVKDTEKLKNYIINIYNVLMTRGIKGTYVYVCDEGLREYLKKYIQ